MQNNQILFIQNYDIDPPGSLAHILENRGISFTVCNMDKQDPLPTISNLSALIVLGGRDSANDKTPKIQNQLTYIRDAIDNHIPYLGICLGLQLGVKAMGGTVFKNHISEAGFKNAVGNQYKARLTTDGRHDLFLKGLRAEFAVFESHDDTVNITGRMQLLAEGVDCINQIVKIGEKAYGTQFHFELTPDMFARWFRENPRFSGLNLETLEAEYQAAKRDYDKIAKLLFTNFLFIAGI